MNWSKDNFQFCMHFFKLIIQEVYTGIERRYFLLTSSEEITRDIMAVYYTDGSCFNFSCKVVLLACCWIIFCVKSKPVSVFRENLERWNNQARRKGNDTYLTCLCLLWSVQRLESSEISILCTLHRHVCYPLFIYMFIFPSCVIILMDGHYIQSPTPMAFLKKCSSHSSPSTQFLIQLTQFILTHNHFFDSQHYFQAEETAMGTQMIPSIQTCSWASLNRTLFCSWEAQFLAVLYQWHLTCMASWSQLPHQSL